MTFEPGIDLHEWQTRWEELQEAAAEDPVSAVPETARFVQQMLEEQRFQLDEPVTVEGETPDIVREFLASREVADRIDRGESVDPGDVAVALENLGEVYAYLVGERPPP